MIISQTRLGKSPALGLWAKYSFVMDELYELVDPIDEDAEVDAPDEVLALLKNTDKDVLAAMFESAEQDRDKLLEAAAGVLETSFAPHRQFISIDRRRTNDPWVRRRHITGAASDAPLPKGPVWATVSIDTDPREGSLSLTTFLWSKGGQRAAQVLRQLPSAVRDPLWTQELGLSADCVVLSCLSLNKYAVSGEIALDMDRLVADLSADLEKNDGHALSAMLNGLRTLS